MYEITDVAVNPISVIGAQGVIGIVFVNLGYRLWMHIQ
jgi:hypothetical protein